MHLFGFFYRKAFPLSLSTPFFKFQNTTPYEGISVFEKWLSIFGALEDWKGEEAKRCIQGQYFHNSSNMPDEKSKAVIDEIHLRAHKLFWPDNRFIPHMHYRVDTEISKENLRCILKKATTISKQDRKQIMREYSDYLKQKGAKSQITMPSYEKIASDFDRAATNLFIASIAIGFINTLMQFYFKPMVSSSKNKQILLECLEGLGEMAINILFQSISIKSALFMALINKLISVFIRTVQWYLSKFEQANFLMRQAASSLTFGVLSDINTDLEKLINVGLANADYIFPLRLQAPLVHLSVAAGMPFGYGLGYFLGMKAIRMFPKLRMEPPVSENPPLAAVAALPIAPESEGLRRRPGPRH